MSAQLFPVAVEKAFISSEVNSTILYVFLWGFYTVIYLGTLYFYLNKKSSRSPLIVGAISISYVAYSADVVMVWYINQSAIVNGSETRDSLFAALVNGPQWPVLVTDVIAFVLAAVADGILIWRCFHVCGQSLRAILIPTFLLFCEIVVDLAMLITFGAEHLSPSNGQIDVLNRLLAAQAFVTFATTLTSTTIIAYRVYVTSTRDGIPKSSRRLLKHVLEILVQSAAAYSLVAIAQAISSVVPQTSSNAASWDAAEIYTSILFTFISGVAPTVLVARVATLGDNDTYLSTGASMPLSGLQFHVQSIADEGSQSGESNDHVERSLDVPQSIKNFDMKDEITLMV